MLSLTREAKRRSQDLTGRIDHTVSCELLRRFDGGPAQVFICGSNSSVDSVSDGIIAAGVAPASSRPNVTVLKRCACCRVCSGVVREIRSQSLRVRFEWRSSNEEYRSG